MSVAPAKPASWIDAAVVGVVLGLWLSLSACSSNESWVGARCSPGASVPAADGCNHCTCGANGELFDCTQDFCPICENRPEHLRPAPGEVCRAGPIWARDPQTGICCQHGSSCEAALGWKTFATEAECNPLGCACNLEGAWLHVGSLACRCQAPTDCPTLEDVYPSCIRFPLLTRGCGVLEVSSGPNFTGGSASFDEQTGSLLELTSFSDIEWGVCGAITYVSRDPALLADPSCVPATCNICGDELFADDSPTCPPLD